MNSAQTSVGAVLWTLITAIPLAFLCVSFWRYFVCTPRKPFVCQPVQGIRAVEGEHPTFILPVLFQLLLIIGSVFSAIIIFPWIVYPGLNGFNTDTPTQTLVKIGSMIVAYVYAFVSVKMGIYQVLFMLLYQAKCTFALSVWGSIPELVAPKLWARQCFLLSLQCAAVSMIGLVSVLCGDGRTNLSFFLFVIVTVISPLQLFMLKRYIEAMPGPHVGGAPGYPQCPPSVGYELPAVSTSVMIGSPVPLVVEGYHAIQFEGAPLPYRMSEPIPDAIPISPPPQLTHPQQPLPPQLPPSTVSTYMPPMVMNAMQNIWGRGGRTQTQSSATPASPSN